MYALGKQLLGIATSGYTPAFCMDFRAGENINGLRQFVYIMLCTFLREYNDWGSCSVRSFSYICLNAAKSK